MGLVKGTRFLWGEGHPSRNIKRFEVGRWVREISGDAVSGTQNKAQNLPLCSGSGLPFLFPLVSPCWLAPHQPLASPQSLSNTLLSPYTALGRLCPLPGMSLFFFSTWLIPTQPSDSRSIVPSPRQPCNTWNTMYLSPVRRIAGAPIDLMVWFLDSHLPPPLARNSMN